MHLHRRSGFGITHQGARNYAAAIVRRRYSSFSLGSPLPLRVWYPSIGGSHSLDEMRAPCGHHDGVARAGAQGFIRIVRSRTHGARGAECLLMQLGALQLNNLRSLGSEPDTPRRGWRTVLGLQEGTDRVHRILLSLG